MFLPALKSHKKTTLLWINVVLALHVVLVHLAHPPSPTCVCARQSGKRPFAGGWTRALSQREGKVDQEDDWLSLSQRG